MVRANIEVESIKSKGDYTIDDFLREKTEWENRFELKQQMEKEALLIKDEKKRADYIKQWHKNHERRAYFDWDYFNADKPWDKYRVKKDEFNGETVLKIDKEKRVIVTIYNNSLFFYYIKDDSKPSLYGNSGIYTYNL